MANWKDKFLADLDEISQKKKIKDYRAFIFWYVQATEAKSDDEVLSCITDGSNDGGIDAIIIDRNTNIIRIIQSKFSRGIGEKVFQKDEINKLNKIADFLSGRSDIYELRNYVSKNLKDKIDTVIRLIKEEGYRPKLYFITTNRSNGNSDLYNDGEIPIEIIASKEIESKYEAWMHGHTPDLGEIILDFVSVLEGPTNPKSYLVTLSSETLRKQYQIFKNKLFSRNVRVFYGESPKANKNMKKTLAENPQNFWYFNNGITILSEKVNFKNGDKKIFLKNPQIINGCQTVSTIGESKPSESLLFAKIIEIADSVSNQLLIDGIIESNNRQTPVDERMLKSNHPLQIKLQRELKEKGFFYERKEKEYDLLKTKESGIAGLEKIKNIRLVKSNLAIIKSPYLCEAKENDLFSVYFNEVFSEEKSYMDYVVPYLIWREINYIAQNFHSLSRQRFQKLSSYHILRIIYDYCRDLKNPIKINEVYNKLIDQKFDFDSRIIKDLFELAYEKFRKTDFVERDSGQRDFFKNKGTYSVLANSLNNSMKKRIENIFK